MCVQIIDSKSHPQDLRNETSLSVSLARAEHVPGFATPDNEAYCIVFLLDRYFEKLLRYAFEKEIFYLRTKPSPPADPSLPWFDNTPVGKNKLSTMVRDMCVDAKITGKTNHMQIEGYWGHHTLSSWCSREDSTKHYWPLLCRRCECISNEQHQAAS